MSIEIVPKLAAGPKPPTTNLVVVQNGDAGRTFTLYVSNEQSGCIGRVDMWVAANVDPRGISDLMHQGMKQLFGHIIAPPPVPN